MHSRLKEILAEKREEVKTLRKRGLAANRGNELPRIRDFRGAISLRERIAMIAEIKFSSPSAGLIRKESDPLSIARIYQESGAAAISLLTDKKFFGGGINHLPRLKENISLPILRKDFIIDEVQVRESFLYGADAILLIARLLSHLQLQELLELSGELGLAPLTEVHDRRDIEKAVDCGAVIIGINNRDLDTFEVDLNTTLELCHLVPGNRTIVSESGITDAVNIRSLHKGGIQAVLVGSSLMKSNDIAKKTRELISACVAPDASRDN